MICWNWERSINASHSNGPYAKFGDWIFENGLEDVGYGRSAFTWMNNKIFKRLGRRLVNGEWKNRFLSSKKKL